ncbi:MAG TPA: LysM peptidoglycan-binding domain-containing protein [Longimicrobium sp.]|nr:LysM peptidoglycan-binding domain-containing protein [Longimicrobium sp.]
MPEPVPVEPEKVDEGFAIERVRNGTVGRELLGSATYDLPVEPNQWVSMELDFLVNQRKDVVGRWMQRAERYETFVRETFAAAGIPRDLHHLAMVESGYQPTARSHAGAVGMWQFMPATGRGMGLRIDDQVDERMDPVRSTRAAARHLRDLYNDFGRNWPLAAAAYNAGGGRISRGMANYSATDFWDLASRGNLAQETRRYVPRLYAVTIIAKDPARFGYQRPTGLVRRFEFDSIQVDLPTPLPVLARIASVPLGELAELNPHLRQGVVPSFYWLWVPKGQGSGMQQAYATSDYKRRGGYQLYTLRRGEDAQKIALASNLTLEQLRELNLSTNLDRLGRGDRIRLYADAARALGTRRVERLASRDDDAGDEPRERRRASSRSDSDGESESSTRRTRRASGNDADGEETGTRRSRTASSDDEGTSTRTASSRRSSEEEGTSTRRSRSSGSDDETPSSRRSRSRESDESTSTRRVASRSASEPEGSERPSRTRRAADDDEAPSRREGESGARRQQQGTSALSAIARHTVEQGETLFAIGRRYGVPLERLLQANDLTSAAVLQPGQKIRIPRASASSESRETRTASASRRSNEESRSERTETRTAASSRRGSDEPRSERSETRSTSRGRVAQHVVKNGETLWSIARSYDTTVAAIRQANDMREDSVLQPGQTLRIPRPAPGRNADR